MIININFKQRLALGFSLALAILILFTFIYAVKEWRDDWALAHQAPPVATIDTTDATGNIVAAIPNAHLFGKAFTNDVPITNLQLRVTGIVKVNGGQNSALSKAYISISGQPSKIYQVGDTLPYGVKVYEITNDAVILENDGRIEKLPLPREKLQFKMRNEEERL